MPGGGAGGWAREFLGRLWGLLRVVLKGLFLGFSLEGFLFLFIYWFLRIFRAFEILGEGLGGDNAGSCPRDCLPLQAILLGEMFS